MGKKHRSKAVRNRSPQSKVNTTSVLNKKSAIKLPPQKMNELNTLVDKLLKVSTVVQTSNTPNSSKDWETHLEIEKILNKIRAIESDLKLSFPNRTTKNAEELLTWVKNNSAEVNGVGIKQFPDHGLGLVALTDIALGDLMMAIPRKLMITYNDIKSSKLGYLLDNDIMMKHMPNVDFALFLLLERYEDSPSFWKPYIQMLPSSYTTVLYFSSHELQELKGSLVLESALKQCRNIARQYAYFHKLFQNMADPASEILRDVFTYDQYRWAVSTVMTRYNLIPSADGMATENALIPLWDLANHSNGMISTAYNLGHACCECVAWRQFSEGEEVFICYGQRNNADFLLHNGFVYPDNIDDSVRIRLGIAKSDPLHDERSKVLARLSLSTASDFGLHRGSQPVDGTLLAFLRIFSMQQEHLEHWAASEKVTDLTYSECSLESEVEAKAWQFLLARIKLLQRIYPTTLEDDLKILKEDMSLCQRFAIQLRVAEKSILQSALEYIEQRDKP